MKSLKARARPVSRSKKNWCRAFFLTLFIAGCGNTTTIENTTTEQAPTFLYQLAAPSSCIARNDGMLPDPKCTPGAADPAVTQGNIQQTICVPGYTAKVRPPVSLTNALKRSQIHAYGYADTNLAHYEEDHLASLELGGAPSDPKNLWPEYPHSPNKKDRLENFLHKQICTGKILLAQAQHEIETNWVAAYKKYFRMTP
jgi:hypothetical protein